MCAKTVTIIYTRVNLGQIYSFYYCRNSHRGGAHRVHKTDLKCIKWRISRVLRNWAADEAIYLLTYKTRLSLYEIYFSNLHFQPHKTVFNLSLVCVHNYVLILHYIVHTVFKVVYIFIQLYGGHRIPLPNFIRCLTLKLWKLYPLPTKWCLWFPSWNLCYSSM